MTDKIYKKEEWLASLTDLKEQYKLYVPVKDGDYHNIKPLEEGIKPDFDYQNSRLSPKSAIFPQSERMFEYSLDENNPDHGILKESEKDYRTQALVGIRPCDAHAMEIVKRNFDTPEYRDYWWVKHRETTILIGLGCNEPCSTCFCTETGGDPFGEKELDVLLHDLGEQYLARGLTDQGIEFLKKAGGTEADKKTLEQAADLAVKAREKIKTNLPTDKLKDKVLNELFDAPFWEEIGFSCLNCGTCTYLCPTCWCFDIQDEVYGKEGDRMRNWDSCMYPLFTHHGSGHNPRDQKYKRVRQRFMHKLKYYVDKYQKGVQCSGCGRCVRYCPVNIDIRQVAKLMNEF